MLYEKKSTENPDGKKSFVYAPNLFLRKCYSRNYLISYSFSVYTLTIKKIPLIFLGSMDEYMSALSRADSVLLREALDLSRIDHQGGGVADEEPGKGETVTFL